MSATFSHINNEDTGLSVRNKINDGFDSVITELAIGGATGPAGPAGATGATGPAGSGSTMEYGSFYHTLSSNPTVTFTTTWTKISPTITGSTVSTNMSYSTARLTYTGASTKKFFVVANSSNYIGAASSQFLSLGVSKNGATPYIVGSVYNTVGQELTFGCSGIISLAQNDYLELFVKTDSGSHATSLIDLDISIHSLD